MQNSLNYHGSSALFRKSYPIDCPAVICLVKVERLRTAGTSM